MSENRPPRPKLEGYFAAESAILKIGSTLTFDCFLYLPHNDKVVHWLKEGVVFGTAHSEKLTKFGHPQIFIMNEQAHLFEKYASGVQVVPGDDQRKLGHIHIKGAPRKSEVFRIFGTRVGAATEQKPETQPPAKTKVDVDFVNTVIKSVQAVFKEVCKTEVKFSSPTKRSEKAVYPFQVNVASFIALNSQSVRGTVGLCFPAKSYLNFMTAAIGQPFTDFDLDLALGAGEFMHHIFEASRPNLVSLGYLIDPAVPFIVRGEDIAVPFVLPDKGFSILFDSSCGPFQFEIGIKQGN